MGKKTFHYTLEENTECSKPEETMDIVLTSYVSGKFLTLTLEITFLMLIFLLLVLIVYLEEETESQKLKSKV